MPGLGDVPSARAGAVPDARAGTCPKSSAGSRPQSSGACLGGDAQGSQWLVLPVLEHQPSGERVERPKTCLQVLRGPTVLTEGREMSAEGESLGSPSPGGTKAAGPWQGCDRGTHAAPAGAGAGHGAEAPRLRPHSSPAFPHLGRRGGWHGHPPAPARLWAQSQGTHPRQSPLPWPRCRLSCAGEGRTRTRSNEDFRSALEEKEGRTKRSWEEAIPGPLVHFKRKQSRLSIFSFPDPVFHFKSALTFWLSFLLISQVLSVRIHSSVWHRQVQREITPGDERAPQCPSATSLPWHRGQGDTGGHPAPVPPLTR